MPDGSRQSPAIPPSAGDVAPAIAEVVQAQRSFFAGGNTLPQRAREEVLRAFLSAVQKHESQIIDALAEDMGRSSTEAYLSNLAAVVEHIAVPGRCLPFSCGADFQVEPRLPGTTKLIDECGGQLVNSSVEGHVPLIEIQARD